MYQVGWRDSCKFDTYYSLRKSCQVLNWKLNESFSGLCAVGTALLEFERRQIDEIFYKSHESSGSKQARYVADSRHLKLNFEMQL